MTNLRLVLFLAILTMFADGQVDTRVSATWQVVKYDISVTLPQGASDRNISSKAKLDLKNISSGSASTLTLRISPAAVVSTVTINGTQGDFTKGEEKIGSGSLQRIVVRVPSVPASGSLSVIVDYKMLVAENSGVATLSPSGSQFLPLSYWYPTPNSWFFARGADYAPFRVTVSSPGQTVISSGRESAGAFEQSADGQPFFLVGTWESTSVDGVTVLLPKGSGGAEQKLAAELAALTSEAKAFVSRQLGEVSDVPLRLVAVQRAGGFSGNGTVLIDDGVFRRGRIDSQTAMNVADAVAKVWLGGRIRIVGDGGGVLREGLTKYIATQFLESKFGKAVADIERQRQRVAYASVSRRDSPLTVVSPLDDYYYPEVANKGAMVWRILARRVGGETFFKAVRAAGEDGSTSLSEVNSQFAPERELLDHLFNQVTETNLLAGLPQIVGGETRVALRNTGPIDVTVDVTATMANGERLSAPTTVRAKSFGEITFRTTNRISSVEIDPEKLYPQTDYSDDVAPRQTTESDWLLATKRLFDKQEYANAEKMARSALRDLPRLDDVRVLLARSLLALGRTAEAEREFKAVLDEKLPTSRSIAWSYVGLADIASRDGQSGQAAAFAAKAIEADAEYGASLAARGIRKKLMIAPNSDESVRAFFVALDKTAISNRKAELEAMAVPGEAGRFVSGLSGQVVEMKTELRHIDKIDADNVWAEVDLSIRVLNREVETGTAVYRLTKAGNSWKLRSVDIFEVR